MLRFLIDTQLPPVLAAFFNRVGHDAIHTTYFPQGQFLNDDQIVEISIRERRIIVTKDSDFFEVFCWSHRFFYTLPKDGEYCE